MYLGLASKVPSVPRKLITDNCHTLNVKTDKALKHRREGLIAEYITTRMAIPHRDVGFDDVLFLTMSLRANFDVGGVWMKGNDSYLPLMRGTFFLINPTQLHWLHPSDYGVESLALPRWWGLQWDIPVDDSTEEVIRAIMKSYDAEWEASDKRFKKLMMKKKKKVDFG